MINTITAVGGGGGIDCGNIRVKIRGGGQAFSLRHRNNDNDDDQLIIVRVVAE